MNNNENILVRGSKVFKLIEKLKKEASICLANSPNEAEKALSLLEALSQIFKPFCIQRKDLEEQKRRHELEQKELCAKEGHIGEWSQEERFYTGLIDRIYVENYSIGFKWVRTCTRCGETETVYSKPKEITLREKKKKIEELKAELKKLESEQ